jgi:hypothetical protein
MPVSEISQALYVRLVAMKLTKRPSLKRQERQGRKDRRQRSSSQPSPGFGSTPVTASGIPSWRSWRFKQNTINQSTFFHLGVMSSLAISGQSSQADGTDFRVDESKSQPHRT